MSFLDEFEKTTATTAPKKTPSGGTPPVKATPTSFLGEFEAQQKAPAQKPAVSASVPDVAQAVASVPLPKTTISAPTGKEVRPLATRVKEFTDKLFGINEKRGSVAETIKNQQKAYEELVNNPSVDDIDGVSPFKSIQAGRDQRKATVPTAKGVLEGLTDIDSSDTPFAGALLDAKEIGEVYLISQKMQKDQPVTPEEMVKLRSYFEKEDMLNQKRKTDAGYRIGETIRNSLTFMLELGGATIAAPETAGTSYGALIAQKGALKVAKETAERMLADKVVREALIKDLKEYGIKAAGKGSVIIGSQAAVHVPEGTLERMIGTPVFSNNMGEISVEVVNDGQPINEAVLNAFTESLVETASEYSGGIFEALPSAVKSSLIKSGIFKSYLAKNPNLTPDVVDRILKSVGWNGVVGEMAEEQVANVAYGILNTAGLSDNEFHVPTKQDILEQLITFALMGTAIKTVGDSYRKIVKDNLPQAQGDGKVLTDIVKSYVEEAVQTESPEQIIKDLKEMGMDNATAFGIVNNATLSDMAVDSIDADALQAEIDSFMSGGAVEDGEKSETAKVAEKLKEEQQPAPEAKLDVPMEQKERERDAMKETAPFAINELDIPEEKLQEAENDWVDNYADDYGDLAAESMDLSNQIKSATGERKRMLKARLDTLNKRLSEVESEFLAKYAPDTLVEQDQLEGTFDKEATPFPPAEYSDTNLIVKEGDFIVNRDGEVEEVVSGNEDSVGDEINEGFIRTRKIGSEGDYLNYANQVRKASEDEVEKAKEMSKEEKPKEIDQIVKEEKRKKAPAKKAKKEGKSDIAYLKPEYISEKENPGENRSSSRELFAEEVVKYIQAVNDKLGWSVDEADRTGSGKISVKKAFNHDYVSVILWKNDKIGIYISIDSSGYDEVSTGTILYRATTPAIKYTGMSNNYGNISTSSEDFATIIEDLVAREEGKLTAPTKRETKEEKAKRLELEKLAKKIQELSKDEKAEIDRFYSIFKRMFEVYDEVQLEFPQMFVAETQEKAMETVAQEFELPEEEQAFVLDRIAYMGPGYVDSLEKFTEYYVSRNLFDKTVVEETEARPVDSIEVGDMFDTKGGTNMESPITVTAIEGNTVKFQDANGVDYSGMAKKQVKTMIKEGAWDRVEAEGIKLRDVDNFFGIPVVHMGNNKDIDNVDDSIENEDDDNIRQKGISDVGEVSAGEDRGSSEGASGEVPGYERASMLTQSGNGPRTKRERQLVNEVAEQILESTEYSTNPEDYSENDRNILAAYTGAGGKESVGAEGAGLLNEYYTPVPVIDKMWEITDRLLPNGGEAFEPSAGIGRIIGRAPVNINVDGAEISRVSGTIAKILYPESNITIGDFQELFFDRKTNKIKPFKQYDAVIGNPPFGDRGGFLKGKGEESDISRWEEYFIKRGLDMTKEGGYLVYVVNSSFLKNGISKGKRAIAGLGTLVDAYRLPEDAFEDTSIGTDVVVFRKEETLDPISISSRGMTLSDDVYFRSVMNKDHILGETKVRKNKFGQPESYVDGSMEDALAKIKLDYIQPVEVRDEVQEEVEDVVTSAEQVVDILEGNKPVSTKKRQKTAKTGEKEGKIKADRQMITPKENAKELVVEAQDVSNKGNYSPIEVEMLKRIDRDMSIPNPSSSEIPFLNYENGKYYPDGMYFAGEIYQKLEQLEKDKKGIIEFYGQEQYEKQKRGLEAKIPAKIPLKDISFDPIDRHVANLKVVNEEGNDSTVLNMFTSYVRRNSVALSPRVSKYDVIRYVTGERAAKDTKPIMGDIKADAKRLFNHFIKNELDPKYGSAIEEKFNREKNGYVRPNYTVVPVEVRDMAKQFRGRDFSLSQTQKGGVGFLVNKGSGLIAYGVGVGKTHTLSVATVANMQKGWTKRPLFTVPKSTITKTWINTLHEMFPTLTINNLEGLQAPVIARLKRERGEDPKNWIKDGELTVISHEGLLRLGFNEEELRAAAGDINDAIWKDESTKRGKEKKAEKYDEILGNAQKYVTDVMISDLGFDHVSVDEVHNFRKIFQGAKPENLDDEGKPVGQKRYGNVVGGTPSKRAQQLFLISQYIQKKYGGRNVFLASATPFENHATEVYNILSLIARDRMKQMGILNINDFFSVFANFEVELDRTLEGKWIDREKMKSFANLPTLQGLLREFIDYQEDPTLIRPERRVLTPHLPMSEMQEENLAKIQELLTGIKRQVEDMDAFDEDSKTMYNVAGEGVEDGAFLKASTYSIANSVSPHFIKEYIEGVPTAEEIVSQAPKIQYAIEVIKRVKNNPKTQDFGTFVFFGKMGVEYHPILAEHIAKVTGYKPEEVAYISGDVTDEQKEDIKEKFNDGRIKVLLGGDQTKEGIDLQNNGFITLNLALGWNPTQIAQVEGRVWRQGNRRSIAPLLYPLVENSGDAMIYSKFEEKGGRINDLFSYAGTIFDVGEIDPAEKKLALLTDPRDKANMQVEIDKTMLYNERVLIDNDIKELNKLRGDLEQSRNDIEYYSERANDTDYSEESRKEYKKELKKNKERVERLEAKLKTKGIADIGEKMAELEGQILEIDNKIKDIDKTFDEKLKYFTAIYQEELKNRKSIEDHMREVDGLISELEERTPEEIEAMRQQKIKALEEANRAMIPEFLRIEEDEIDEAAQLREESTVLMLDMQNNAGTKEELQKRYDALQKKWEALGRPMFARYEGTDKVTLATVEKLKGRETVSKQFISDLTNSGEIKQGERDAVRAVLEEYPDGAVIPVTEFADKVNASLLPLSVSVPEEPRYEYVNLKGSRRGEVENYVERVYESPVWTTAGIHHYPEFSDSYFAHARSDDMGETRRILEVQSDLFQKGRLQNERFGYMELDWEREDTLLNEFLNFVAKEKGITKEEAEELYASEDVDMTPEDPIGAKYIEAKEAERNKELARLEPYKNIWWQRVIKEEIRRAARDGMTKVLFPTGATALEIEGLSEDKRWTGIKPEGGNYFLNPSNIKEGEIVNDGWEDYVIIENLGNGKFAARTRVGVESAMERNNRDIAEEIAFTKKNLHNLTETFDVSGNVDTENPIYKFYEKDVQKYLRSLGGKTVVDEQGVSWVELAIKPEIAKQPVLAFERMDDFKKKTISFEEGKKRLEAYKKRLGLDFDVDFANVIFTGEKNSKGGRVRAYAVTYNNKITLTENITATTADHEMVHAVLANIDKIDAFDGITYDALLKAQNGGAEWTEADRERLEEGLAIGFERKVAGESMSNVPMVIRKFYDKLMLMLEDFFKAIGKDVNIIEAFYRRMAVGESTNTVKLTPSVVADNIAKFERNGQMGLDFYFQRARYMDDMRRVNFERIVEESKDFSVVLKRRDINYLDNVMAQARDLYLKDKQEFKEADQFMKIGDTRRMKKELLDQKFADMMKPYFDLSSKEQEAVNQVLMQGDRDTKEYTDAELVRSKLDEKQIEAYKAVRKAFNVAHQLLLDEMRQAGVKEEEIETFQKERTGYMPHKWKYRFAIKTQKLKPGTDPQDYSNWVTQSIDVYKTSREQDREFKKLTAENEDKENIRYVADTMDSLDVDFFSEQRFSFENMKSIIAKAKTSADVKDELLGAMRDMVKEKGFGRHFIRRTGVEGYEKKDVPQIIANYFAGLNGFVTKMDAGKQYYAVLEKIDARRQKKFYAWMRDAIAYDMGQTSEWNALKQIAYIYHLANDMSFLLTNATQNWTVGIGELSKLFAGAGKIAGAEAKLVKATADWAIGNITPEEKQVITGLLKVGRLGGEMTSELMGFKNNPLYTALGKGVNYALYNATRFVEQNVNRVPAFLAARRILKDNGLSDKEANERALEVSDDINFRYGKQHRPAAFRGRISTLFVFQHYMRSFLYQLARDLKEKEFMAITKKMFYTALLGGTTALPLARMIQAIVKALFGDDPEEETAAELKTWELALERGIPASFFNVDLSNRVGIDILAITSLLEGGDQNDIRKYLGAIGGLLWWNFQDPTKGGRLQAGVDLFDQTRYIEAFGKLLPDFLGNPFKAYQGYEYGVYSQAGNPLLNEDGSVFKYTTMEAFIKASGYTPTREQLAWEEKSRQWEIKNAAQEAAAEVQDKIKLEIARGNLEEAQRIQAEGLASGAITDRSRDYVKDAVEDKTMRESVEAWQAETQKSRTKLDRIERDIARAVYGDDYTRTQLTNVTRDFAFYRTFGFDDTLANEIRKAQSTEEKVKILEKAREEMGLEAFKAFFERGRTVVHYEPSSNGRANSGYVLISDALREAYFKK